MKRTLFVLILTLLTLPTQAQPTPSMVEAAAAFIATLDADAQETALWSFDDEERMNWHFIPREREGLTLGAMTPEQRRAAHTLFKTALSSQGYLKATSIMALETVLKEIENGSPRRDPERYHVSIFGEPDADGVWGWRLEGHHLSLNFSSVTQDLSVTPAFWGSNPAEVPIGPSTGLRVLGTEEDLARNLMALLDDEQRSRAIIADTAPHDIITGNDREARLDGFEGLPFTDMTEAQRALVTEIVEEIVRNMDDDIAHTQLEKITNAGIENLYFAWAGPLERREGHYYRIHGPTVLFEYDNTQTDANHIHIVWRDLTDDFGADLLRLHYDESDADHGH